MNNTIKVWDGGVRLFHWSLVIFFVLSWLTGEEESSLHIWSGYAVVALLLFRLIWGFIGSHYARFHSFTFSPTETLSYVRAFLFGHPKRYLGHNPLGALMIFALLLSLSGTAISGLMMNGTIPIPGNALPVSAENPTEQLNKSSDEYEEDEENEDGDERENEHLYDNRGSTALNSPVATSSGENAHENGSEEHEWLEEIHEFFANFSLLLVALHIAGVAIASHKEKENLVHAMITGEKRQS